MSGTFGKTDLRTFCTAGRTMFTFARRMPGKSGIYLGGELVKTLPYQELSVSFVAEDNDPTALSAGLQSVHATLPEAMALIEDVIKAWPSEKRAQKKVFADSASVSIF